LFYAKHADTSLIKISQGQKKERVVYIVHILSLKDNQKQKANEALLI